MTEHTSEPWEVEDDVYVVEVASRDIVACCENDFPRDVQESNARRIAATPDLLEVLSIFVDCYPAQIEPLKQRARHLIAKARGE